jgi:hypothetical protein
MAGAATGVNFSAGHPQPIQDMRIRRDFLRLCATLLRNSIAPSPRSFDKLTHSS